jgi:hypothetical protein
MRGLLGLGLSLGALLISPLLMAQTIEVAYGSFYSHVKQLNNPDTDALQFAFGFKHIDHGRLCEISSAAIVTEKQRLVLKVNQDNRFLVPTDKILKLARAQVVIELADQPNKCDMSVQLETQPQYLKTQYSSEDLSMLFSQYQSFFADMGSFLSFLMPSAEGLILSFAEELNLPSELSHLLDESGKIQLSEDWISLGQSLSLPVKPLRITSRVLR